MACDRTRMPQPTMQSSNARPTNDMETTNQMMTNYANNAAALARHEPPRRSPPAGSPDFVPT
jgi:hypothetical protein